MSRSTLDPAVCINLSLTGLSPSLAGFPNTIVLGLYITFAVLNPEWPKSFGLAFFHFARRYFGNRVFFLFLSLLRCFSSRRSLYYTMDSCNSDWAFLSRVPPFGHLRLTGYLLLTAAFRSLSRPSSAPGAKASSLRSSSLDHQFSSAKLYLLKWSSFNAEELFFFILKLIRVRIYHFQISFCLFDNFRYLFEFLGSPLLRSLLITLRLICNFQGPNSSLCELFEVLRFALNFRVLLWKPNSITSEKFVP